MEKQIELVTKAHCQEHPERKATTCCERCGAPVCEIEVILAVQVDEPVVCSKRECNGWALIEGIHRKEEDY